ncbi:cation efflux family-domain-containing protein [Catenaria anguillulae PL171]|uniref:Cation efflux family-domain-containing protein n=1 Tax=Catenaria anguillulae PL171 TaxID=765915 RepID=A0A1Y2HLJ3_9FUNG|nr:cation efflux family-domain-containing protein [Catenaria anguillulae PL171]
MSVASVCSLALGAGSNPWHGIAGKQWPMLVFFAFLSWARLWFTLEAAKHVTLLRIFMLTEYVGLWLPALFAESATGRRGASAAGKHSVLASYRRTAVFALSGALFLELANDFGFTTSSISSALSGSTSSPAAPTSPTLGWIFIGLTIGTIILQSRVKRTLLASSAPSVSGSDASLDTLTLFSASTPISTAMSVIPYFLFGHSSTALESHTLAHLALWMTMLGVTLLVLDAIGNHTAAKQGTPLHTLAVGGWRTAVGTAGVLAMLHAMPSIFDLAGIVLFYVAVSNVVKSDPKLTYTHAGVASTAWASANASPSSKSAAAIFQKDPTARSGIFHTLSMYSRLYLQPIWHSRDSRSIFIFLCINLGYMFIQLLYGVWTNSLGLISDAIHMLFDCIALAVGLMAAVMAKWGSSPTFSFGYGRIETLSGFGNGVFLVFISIFILIEGLERVIHPPEMSTDRLLLVAVGGFVVNLIGVYAFHDHHHHGGGECSHSHDANMQGIFLHILADLLGSLGVIVSTLLIYQFGWTGFDPLASLLIGVLIFASTVPLLKSSLTSLMAVVPGGVGASLPAIRDEITHALNNQVLSIDHRVWAATDKGTYGAFRILMSQPPMAACGCDEATLLDRVQAILYRRGMAKTTIEFQYNTLDAGYGVAPASGSATAGYVVMGAQQAHAHVHQPPQPQVHSHSHSHAHGSSCSHDHHHDRGHGHDHHSHSPAAQVPFGYAPLAAVGGPHLATAGLNGSVVNGHAHAYAHHDKHK